MTVMVAEADLVVSATAVAVRVTVAGLGMFAGALYVTDVLLTFVSVPQALPLQPAPDRDHVRPLFWKSFLIVAVKICVPYPEGMEAEVGETDTEIGKPAPLIDRKAASPAPHVSDAVSVAVAEAVPAIGCI